jgi:hypothetical protein
MWTMVSVDEGRNSQSFDKRRDPFSSANVFSTTQRLGRSTKQCNWLHFTNSIRQRWNCWYTAFHGGKFAGN